MKRVKCPVKECDGYETYSSRPGIANHIKKKASTELLNDYLTGIGHYPHAMFIKENFIRKDIEVYRLKVNNKEYKLKI